MLAQALTATGSSAGVRWALGMWHSRSTGFAGALGEGILPFADLGNHSTESMIAPFLHPGIAPDEACGVSEVSEPAAVVCRQALHRLHH